MKWAVDESNKLVRRANEQTDQLEEAEEKAQAILEAFEPQGITREALSYLVKTAAMEALREGHSVETFVGVVLKATQVGVFAKTKEVDEAELAQL
jgi:hypothetical protein